MGWTEKAGASLGAVCAVLSAGQESFASLVDFSQDPFAGFHMASPDSVQCTPWTFCFYCHATSVIIYAKLQILPCAQGSSSLESVELASVIKAVFALLPSSPESTIRKLLQQYMVQVRGSLMAAHD